MTAAKASKSIDEQLSFALQWLESHATRRALEAMARHGIPSDKALGVSRKDIQALAKLLGRSHELAAALWNRGGYEALRAVGVRNPALRRAAIQVSGRLAVSPNAAAQWVGKDALRQLKGKREPK